MQLVDGGRDRFPRCGRPGTPITRRELLLFGLSFDADTSIVFFSPPAVSSSSFLSRFRRSTTSPRQPAKRHWEERENKDGRKVPRVVAFSTEEHGGEELRDAWGLFEGAGPSERRRDGGLEGGEREREGGILCLNVAVIRARMVHGSHTGLETNLSRLLGCDSSSSGRDYCDTAVSREKIFDSSKKKKKRKDIPRVLKK